ncbi:MAG: TetR/AcrR family transcriptional regulator [Polyangiaceae bacterium]|nr:TetR/AcrR family transcriptional regulator [Polyangiaceae bacterium]
MRRLSSAPASGTAERPTAERGATAERILAAGEELFCQRGFGAVSVRDIAERAGVQKALVFYHYGNKDALFARVLEGYYRAHTEALSRAFAAEGTRRERFHRLIDAYLDFIAGHVRYAVLVQRAVAEPEAHPFIGENLAPLFEWIAGALREVVPSTGPLAAHHFFVTFSGLVINYFTYAPLLRAAGIEHVDRDPASPEALAERKAHVHWVVDVLLDRLEAG